jgi:Secretion system C-terminal sorting domain
MKKIFLFLCTFAPMVAYTQLLLSEDFNYTDSLTKNGWLVVSGGGTNGLIPTAPSLVKIGYVNSDIGKAVDMVASGEDLKKDFPSTVSTGNLYGSFLIKVKTAAKTAGSYVTGFTSGATGSTYNMRFYIKNDSTGGFYFGIGRGTSTPEFAAIKYVFNTTYLVTLKYAYNKTAATNDTVAFYVHPATSTILTEPPVFTFSNMGVGGGSDASGINAFFLRQGTASDSISLTLDGIRVATTWAGSVSKTSAIKSVEKLNIKAYPTLTTGLVAIETANTGFSTDIAVFNTLGQLVLTKNQQNTEGGYTLDLSSLVKGSYFLRLMSNDKMGVQLIEKQ